jgi:serine protease Do
MTITVIAGEAPESEVFKTRGEEDKTVDLGMILIDNSPSVAREYGLKTSQGIVVKQVERGSLAQQNGIRPQDVILEVNRRELRNVADFRNIIAGKKPGSMLMLYVNRDGDEGFVRFVLPE